MTTAKGGTVYVKTLFPFQTVKNKRSAKVFETSFVASELMVSLFEEVPGHFQAVEYVEPTGPLKVYIATATQNHTGGMAVIVAYDDAEAQALLEEANPGCDTSMSLEPDMQATGLPRLVEKNFYVE